jgi:hypothetical protein
MRDIYFERNMGARQNIYFGRHFAWLKYFTYHLVLVLATNYKQHTLSLAEVRKVCYSLAKLYECLMSYVISVYLNLFGWRGREVDETLQGGSGFESLGTSVIATTLPVVHDYAMLPLEFIFKELHVLMIKEFYFFRFFFG